MVLPATRREGVSAPHGRPHAGVTLCVSLEHGHETRGAERSRHARARGPRSDTTGRPSMRDAASMTTATEAPTPMHKVCVARRAHPPAFNGCAHNISAVPVLVGQSSCLISHLRLPGRAGVETALVAADAPPTADAG